jgi:hypothetical protein
MSRMVVFHGTGLAAASEIAQSGLRAGSYVSRSRLEASNFATYRALERGAETGAVVVLEVDPGDISKSPERTTLVGALLCPFELWAPRGISASCVREIVEEHRPATIRAKRARLHAQAAELRRLLMGS